MHLDHDICSNMVKKALCVFRYERKYWSRVMSGVETTSILYIFSLSDYNLDVLEMLPERKRNRMIENTQVFNSVINKDEFRNKNVIVFLNKTDIFIVSWQ